MQRSQLLKFWFGLAPARAARANILFLKTKTWHWRGVWGTNVPRRAQNGDLHPHTAFNLTCPPTLAYPQ